MKNASDDTVLIRQQRGEITEYHIYKKIAAAQRDPHNREVLDRIAQDELRHYGIWKRHTQRDVDPDRIHIWFYALAARMLGVTFTVKLLEGVEKRAQVYDKDLLARIPEIQAILENEEIHERELIALVDEERLRYLSSVVLGLNDALVEFIGMLAGLTFALQNSRIIAVAGLITGVAASLSMGSSEYLSQKSGDRATDPRKAAVYTGFAYLATVILLVLPYLLVANPYTALVLTLLVAGFVILLFTFYMSVAGDLPFWRRFAEMLVISFGIAAVSFVIGVLIRTVLNVNV